MKPRKEKKSYDSILLLLVFLLTGCSAALKKPTNELPPLPKKPSLSTPIPSTSYSERAQTDIEQWQKVLTDTPLMR